MCWKNPPCVPGHRSGYHLPEFAAGCSGYRCGPFQFHQTAPRCRGGGARLRSAGRPHRAPHSPAVRRSAVPPCAAPYIRSYQTAAGLFRCQTSFGPGYGPVGFCLRRWGPKTALRQWGGQLPAGRCDCAGWPPPRHAPPAAGRSPARQGGLPADPGARARPLPPAQQAHRWLCPPPWQFPPGSAPAFCCRAAWPAPRRKSAVPRRLRPAGQWPCPAGSAPAGSARSAPPRRG